MINVKCQTSTTQKITLPLEADQVLTVYQVFVSLIHEWGDIVVAEVLATRDSSENYSHIFTSNDTVSGGVHKVHWRYVISGTTFTKDVYLNFYQPYILSTEYFNNHPELEDDFSDQFDTMERKVRDIINTFCGQGFDSYPSKTLTVDGSNKNTLYLPSRLNKLTTMLIIESSFGIDNSLFEFGWDLIENQEISGTPPDITAFVELVPQSNYWVRYADRGSRFLESSTFSVNGDWGWPYVPTNIAEASDVLITEQFNDDSTMHKHGITQARFDTRSGYTFSESIFDSTGNLDADILLMDYILFVMTLV